MSRWVRVLAIVSLGVVIAFGAIRLFDRDLKRAVLFAAAAPTTNDIQALLAANNNQSNLKDKMIRLIRYYRLINWALPEQADAYGLRGFCYYKMGKYQQAVEYYTIASRLAPDFFWYHYARALSFLQIKQYLAAKEAFALALACDPMNTLQHMLSSKIYLDIIAGQKDVSWIQTHLQQGYYVSNYLKNNPPQENMLNDLHLF